jgi:hypothetical protein
MRVTQLWGSAAARCLKIVVGSKSYATPTYFPAISSTERQYRFYDLLQVIVDHHYPRMLLSAFDISHLDQATWLKSIGTYLKEGILFLDSGIFESMYKRESKWTFEDYEAVIRRVKHDLYASFDLFRDGSGSSKYWSLISDSIGIARETHNIVCVPIFHKYEGADLVSEVLKGLEFCPNSSQMIAVTEKDCGQDLFERAQTVFQIRQALDQGDSKRALHILGCGDPVSMTVLCYSGADSFDSLDWIRAVIDPIQFRRHEFSQLSLLDCTCGACSKLVDEYWTRVVLHNLLAYQTMCESLRSQIREQNLSNFVRNLIGEEHFLQLTELVKAG